MCIIFIIAQVIEITMKWNQIHMKANIHTYNFHVYTETRFGAENDAKSQFSQGWRKVWESSLRSTIVRMPQSKNQFSKHVFHHF